MKAAIACSLRSAMVAVLIVTGSVTFASAQCLTGPSYYPDFSANQSCLSLNGSNNSSYSGSPSFVPPAPQTPVPTKLRLTAAEGGWATSAWYKTPQPVTSGFSTSFAFQIVTPPGDTPADGIAFVIQNNPAQNPDNNNLPYSLTELGQGGCGIGFGDDPSAGGCAPSTGGIPNSVAIEFNTFNNFGSVDPGSNDVAIQNCPNGGANSVDYQNLSNLPHCNLAINATAGGINLTDGAVHVATVNYMATTQSHCGANSNHQCYALDVILDGIDLFPGGVAFDMSTITAGGATATVGFTAATGGSFSEQDIVNWIFAPTVTQSAQVSGMTPTTFTVNGGFPAGGYDLTAAQTSNPQTVQMSLTTIPITQQACNALVQRNSKFPNAQCFVYQNGGGQGQDSAVLFEVTCPANANSSCAANSAFFADLGTDFTFSCAENFNLTCPASTDTSGGSFGLPHLTSSDNLPSVGFLKGEGPDSAHPCTPFADGATPLFQSNQIESFSLGDTSGGAKGASGGTTSCWTMTYLTQNETPTVTVTQPVNGNSYLQNQNDSTTKANYTCTALSSGDPNSVPNGPYLTDATCAATDSPGGAVNNAAHFDTGTVGPHTFTAQVQDSAMNTSQTVVTYTVVAAPVISGPPSATFNVGSMGSVVFSATGYPVPTFTETGALPAGVNFVDNRNGSATLSGTTAVNGIFPIVITAQNAAFTGAHATLAFTLNSAANVPAAGNKCSGVYDGTFKGSLTVTAGQTCVFVGGGITGNVAQSGGRLVLSNAVVGGNIQITGGTFSIGPTAIIKGNLAILSIPKSSVANQVCGTAIAGNLQVQNNGSPVVLGSTSACPGNTVSGSMDVSNNASASVFFNHVNGNLSCTANSTITGSGNIAFKKTGQCATF